MKRKMIGMLAVLLLPAGLLMFGAGVASAARPGCGSTTGNFAGGAYRGTPGGANVSEGTYALMIYQTGALCSSVNGQNNFTAEWNMMAGGLQTDGFSQSGQIYYTGIDNGACLHDFAEQDEFESGAFALTTLAGCDFGGDGHAVWTEFYGSCNCLVSGIDSTIIDASYLWNPKLEWASPWEEDYFGETGYQYSDTPGTPANHSIWYNIEAQSVATGNLQNQCATPMTYYHGTTNSRMSDAETLCNRVESWTQTP